MRTRDLGVPKEDSQETGRNAGAGVTAMGGTATRREITTVRYLSSKISLHLQSKLCTRGYLVQNFF